MTPGMEALAEAARLETARVYSQMQREHTAETVDAVVDEPTPAVHDRRLTTILRKPDPVRVAELRRNYRNRQASA